MVKVEEALEAGAFLKISILKIKENRTGFLIKTGPFYLITFKVLRAIPSLLAGKRFLFISYCH